MSEKGRKKRSSFVILVVSICLITILGFIFFAPKTPDEIERKSFETAKLYLEYSSNVSFESKNVFEYKDPSESGMKNLSINLKANSIKSPTSGTIDLVGISEKNKEIKLSVEYIVDGKNRLFLKFSDLKNFLNNLGDIESVTNILSSEAIEAIERSNGDWILISSEDIEFIVEALHIDSENINKDLVCFENFLEKYDQSTARFFTSTIDDEIEKYVFYTSDDKIEKLSNDMKKCFSDESAKFLIDKIVEIVEDFSGLKAELNENSQLISLSVNNELGDYYFNSETTFSYDSKYFYPDSPETYLTFDDLFKVDN